MKFLVLAVAACLYMASVASEKITEKQGHYFEMRWRLGHFKQSPFIDLYKLYAVAFVLPLHPGRDADDSRNYLPAGDECMLFFEKFQNNQYVLDDIDEFVLLDACLGYLYDSEYHEVDAGTAVDEDGAPNPSIQAGNLVSSDLAKWKEDEKLRELYYNTKIDEFSEEAKECIQDLMESVIKVKHQYPDKVCNNHWLQVFLDFAKCHRTIPAEARNDDSYMKIVYDLVNIRGKECFQFEIRALNEALRTKYANNVFQRANNRLSQWNLFAKDRSLRKQAARRMWPMEVVRLLQAFQGTNKEINMREVHSIIRGVKKDLDESRTRLMRNMAKYANEHIKPEGGNNKATAADPTGMKRYDALVDRLCNFFRSSDNENYYDYSTPFVVMIKMLEYPEIFTITESYFVSHVLNHSYESAPLYLSVSSCNLLTFTQGRFEQKPHNAKLNYVVTFKPDTSNMVQWPDAGFF